MALWSDVLDRTGIGIDDNFFDLGGHSMLAATMLLRAEQAFGRAPGLNVLFEGPTIRQFAHAFRGETSQSAHMVLTWITDAAPGEDRGRPPLIVMPSMFGTVFEWRTFFQGLDVERLEVCRAYLDRELGADQTLLFVTHDPGELPACVTRTLRLERGRVVRAL